MTNAPDYGRAFNAWRNASAISWRDYTRHDFVNGLGDGTLPRANFIHYLIQDYVYLIHYSRAWALGVVKAETLAEMQLCSATVDALVNGEMQLHVQTCARDGIAEDQLFNAAEEPENMAYTRYVLEAGFSGGFLDLMAALAPCVWGYGEIGAILANEGSSETYREWIDTYAGDDYQTACINVGKLLDQALIARLGDDFENSPSWPALCKKFETATRLEIGFWDMGLRGA
ncbi:aminopyrimidine aminohydrolase [Amylibacter ulvae]|uniref:Aminopyrimidine aminohydrolase n=1 Tax=Paramylibacter ulvae TaxID=1651968 RepID=A0ABQ3D1N6_9RHOB|nr:thiaminase II [Amylibacter ulvae]GHA51534.1 aminopyrimidine aminohydrolase [Amylibacter ulvae]